MKAFSFFFFASILSFASVFAQQQPKPKHLLPNGEPDRPFTFFVKHGFSCYTDAATRAPFASRPAYNFGGGVRVEDDDKNSPAFLEVSGMYSITEERLNGGFAGYERGELRNLNAGLNIYFVLLNNASKSFRWNAGTGAAGVFINNKNASGKVTKLGINFTTQAEMLLKHKRFNVFANYCLIPISSGFETYNYNTLNFGMGFYFR